MNSQQKILGLVLILAGLCTALAHAQPGPIPVPAPEAKKDRPPEPLPPPMVEKEPPRDPTEPGPAFDYLLSKAGKLPPINLRAKIIARNRPPMAIIEIDGKDFLVTKSSVVDGPGYILEVLDIQPTELQLKWAAAKTGPKILILK